jgi:surface polysaccharide O-acyltransferase-like enzyme
MASSEAVQVRPVAAQQSERQDAGVVRPAHNVALGYLRGFLVVLVLAHHSVLAYIDGPPQAKSLLVQPPYWRAFMVVDSQHWTGFGLFTGFNDDFFMSLMFFVSGLFLWSSLKRKGNAAFITDRLRRLGIPFLFAAAIIAPVAYYPSYLLTTGAHSVGGYIHDWLSFGDWPTGPAWFIWLLLAFDLVAAALYAIRPNFGDALGRIASNARQHPVRFFLLLVTVSAAVFIPMLAIFGAMSWTSIGPFQFQTARLFHYAVYFLAGIGVGAYGIDRGLLAPDGILARHWMRWTIAMLVVFTVSVVFMLVVITKGATMSPVVLNTVGGAMFALTCGATSFAFMALFVRFATRRRWLWDSLSDNEYGMYLIHYMFVSWLQLAILSAPLPAIAKGLLVFAGVLLLSWSTSASLRRIPAVARIV